MILYAAFIDLDNSQYKLYNIEIEQISNDAYEAQRALHINYSTTITKISNSYFELLLCIGKTDKDKVFIYYTLDKDKALNKIIDYVNKNTNNQITEKDIEIV